MKKLFLRIALGVMALIAPVAQATNYYNDTFTAADGTFLEAHTSNSGHTYTNVFGSNTLKIGSNRVYPVASDFTTLYRSSATVGSADTDITAVIRFITLAGDLRLYSRTNSSSNSGYMFYINPTDVYVFTRDGGGGLVQLGTASFAFSAATDYTIVARSNGSSLSIYVNGSLVMGPITDTTYTGVGVVAFNMEALVASPTTGLHVDSLSYDSIPTGLVAGTISLSTVTDTTASLTGTASSGGTGSLTYQWYRSTSSGFTPGGGNIVSGATSQNLSDTGLTGATTYYYKRRTTDAASATADSNELTVATCTGFATNSGAILYSPYTWNVSSGSAISSQVGAYIRTSFTGTSLRLQLDNTTLSGVSERPVLRYSVDNSAWTNTTLAFGTDTITLASGLADATHTVTILFNSSDGATQDRWTTPVSAVKITRYLVDASKTMTAVSARTKNLIVYGDSIIENYSAGQPAWAWLLGEALDSEAGVVGNAYQGWCQSTPDNMPPLFTPGNDTLSAWNKNYAGASRLSGGLFSPAPDYVISNMGENDAQFGSSDAAVTAAVTGWMTAVRAAAPLARIYIIIPFGQAKASAITAGFTAYTADTNVRLIDFGSIGFGASGGSATAWTGDNVHPTQLGHARLAALVAARLATDIVPTTTGGAHAFAF